MAFQQQYKGGPFSDVAPDPHSLSPSAGAVSAVAAPTGREVATRHSLADLLVLRPLPIPSRQVIPWAGGVSAGMLPAYIEFQSITSPQQMIEFLLFYLLILKFDDTTVQICNCKLLQFV